MARPPFLTLALRAEPNRVAAPIVKYVQRWCNDSKYVFPKLLVDGVFGPHTAQETEELLYRMGAPAERCRPAIGPSDLLVLWLNREEGQKLPADWATRRVKRVFEIGLKARWGISWRSWKALHPGEFPPVTEASPDPSGIRLYSREELGLPSRIGGSAQSFPVSQGGVFHHQGSGRGAVGLEAAMAQWRAWYRYHVTKWSDIGYNLGIPKGCPVGTVFTGRGLHTRGAHAGPGNDRLGILFMIGSTDGTPTDDMFKTAQMVRAAYCRGDAKGHRDFMSTSCPGSGAYAWTRKH